MKYIEGVQEMFGDQCMKKELEGIWKNKEK